MNKPYTNSITDVPGIKVGHAQDMQSLTGCTVILCEKGAVGGVDQRGGAPGTRETDVLRPMHLVNRVHAIVLAGGSAYGLDASSGVMRYLEEKGIGFNTGPAKVPIVSSAILYDLAIGDAKIRPDAQMGYEACQNASTSNHQQGNVGAGTGATVGKIFGTQNSMKSGIGTASIQISKDVFVGAIIAVNAFGDILDLNGKILAGALPFSKGPIKLGEQVQFANTLETMKTFAGQKILEFASKQNTVIGVVATNAILTKEEANKVAQMAHNGLAMTIKPAHTMLDGDTLFCMATRQKRVDVNIVGAFAAEATALAIINAVMSAEPVVGLKSATSFINE